MDFLIPEKGGMVFICGKGGVGKTTFSALFSLYTSRGILTKAYSIDPAHHLGNVFNVPLKGMKKIDEMLYAEEKDIDILIKEYLENSIQMMKSTYKNLQILNLDKYFNVLRNSPGVEEDAIANFIFRLMNEWEGISVIDTPPTGVMFRILNLPWVQDLWIDQLISLRSKIVGYKETIESINAGKKVEIRDKILMELVTFQSEVKKGKEFLMDAKRSKFVVVTVSEKLPMLELDRFNSQLKGIGISISAIVLNRYVDNELNREYLNEIKKMYSNIPKILVPLWNTEVIGIDNLEKMVESIEVII